MAFFSLAVYSDKKYFGSGHRNVVFAESEVDV